MSIKAQWIAMHRFDIPVNGDWSGFAGIAHGGYRRQDTIIRRNPHMFSVIYTMPFHSVSLENNRPLDFPNYGNLFDSYSGDLPRMSSEFRWSWYRGWWINWTRVDIDQIVDRWSPQIPNHVQYWMIDNIPEWYRASGYNRARFIEQVQVMYKCLRGIHDVPVFGNVYQGGTHADAFLEVADGLLFENWRWFWASGTPLSSTTITQIETAIARALSNPAKFVVLHVPAMPKPQVDDALDQIREKLERYGAERVLFYEHRPASGTVSVRRQIMQISAGAGT
jgi:hypothetical protein